MIAIITGDIINSRTLAPDEWMTKLKEVLNSIGQEPKDWEIYRGDSFQLKVKNDEALNIAVILKAAMKQFKELDIRIAIGLGEINYIGSKLTESNGTAFIRSGECFEALKKETLAIKSDLDDFDQMMNLMFSLATHTMNTWSPISSQIIEAALRNPDLNQSELGALLGNKSQGTISEGLNRGGFYEIQKMLLFYKEKIASL